MARTAIHRFWRCPELPFVESRCANDSRACYAPHAHAAWSIGAVDGGSSVLTRGDTRRRLVRGDMVLIAPDEVHCCNPDDDSRWSYQMLYLENAWLRGVLNELGEDGERYGFDASGVPEELDGWTAQAGAYGGGAATGRRRAGTAASPLHGRLTRLNALLFSDAPPQDKEAALVLFAGDVFACGAAASATRRARSTPSPGVVQTERLCRVREAIADRCTETLRLDELAAIGGMSRYHLLRAFRAAYGMTPHAWQIDQRIACARKLLGEGMSLAETALHLGFADQSHFHRAFKLRVAATPGEYRQGAGAHAAISFKT